jgi:two-component system sensor histidine kinase KdpD
MRDGDDIRMWVGVGLVGPLLVGIALMPLRSVTPASNLAFVFLPLTIVVAEQGGRVAALVSAIVSALSLNFFLTEPYFSFTIDSPEDVTAFAALAVCGVIAAAFGTRRGRWSEIARRAGQDLSVVRLMTWQLRNGVPLDDVLSELLRRFGLRAIVLRGPDGRMLAAAGADAASLPAPTVNVDPDTLVPCGHAHVTPGLSGVRLPTAGARVCLRSGDAYAVLDLWAGPEALGVYQVRALSVCASMLALECAHRQGETVPNPEGATPPIC